MDFAFSDRTHELMTQLTAFMEEHVYPAEPIFASQALEQADPWGTPPIMEELKA